jgi:hypothetical protein
MLFGNYDIPASLRAHQLIFQDFKVNNQINFW